jgi:hypothetical protein
MAAIMARSLKLNYYGNTSRAYIYKIQLGNNLCSGCSVVCEKVFCCSLRWGVKSVRRMNSMRLVLKIIALHHTKN